VSAKNTPVTFTVKLLGMKTIWMARVPAAYSSKAKVGGKFRK